MLVSETLDMQLIVLQVNHQHFSSTIQTQSTMRSLSLSEGISFGMPSYLKSKEEHNGAE